MDKESYYEMCEMLGTEPDPNEIPVEFEDLHLDVQEAFTMYNMLSDMWDTMNGSYMGKNYAGFIDIMELHGIDDKKLMFSLVKEIDKYRSKALKALAKKPQKPT